MNGTKISLDERAIAEFCDQHHIRKFALFGSVLRSDFGPESDVDVLIEFELGHVPGFGFIGLQDELSRLLGRTVDLNTPQSLSASLRDKVLAEAEVIYAA